MASSVADSILAGQDGGWEFLDPSSYAADNPVATTDRFAFDYFFTISATSARSAGLALAAGENIAQAIAVWGEAAWFVSIVAAVIATIGGPEYGYRLLEAADRADEEAAKKTAKTGCTYVPEVTLDVVTLKFDLFGYTVTTHIPNGTILTSPKVKKKSHP